MIIFPELSTEDKSMYLMAEFIEREVDGENRGAIEKAIGSINDDKQLVAYINLYYNTRDSKTNYNIYLKSFSYILGFDGKITDEVRKKFIELLIKELG